MCVCVFYQTSLFISIDSGFITEDELLSAMSKFKNGVTREEVQKMIKYEKEI